MFGSRIRCLSAGKESAQCWGSLGFKTCVVAQSQLQCHHLCPQLFAGACSVLIMVCLVHDEGSCWKAQSQNSKDKDKSPESQVASKSSPPGCKEKNHNEQRLEQELREVV